MNPWRYGAARVSERLVSRRVRTYLARTPGTIRTGGRSSGCPGQAALPMVHAARSGRAIEDVAVAEIWRRHGIVAASFAWLRQKAPPRWNPTL